MFLLDIYLFVFADTHDRHTRISEARNRAKSECWNSAVWAVLLHTHYTYHTNTRDKGDRTTESCLAAKNRIKFAATKPPMDGRRLAVNSIKNHSRPTWMEQFNVIRPQLQHSCHPNRIELVICMKNNFDHHFDSTLVHRVEFRFRQWRQWNNTESNLSHRTLCSAREWIENMTT